MPKSEAPLLQLQSYLPEGSFDEVLQYLQHYKVHLTITRQRQSILGDYRHAHEGKTHRISVNGNLNKYAFLITLLHELAHLFTYERFGHRVMAHGAEWKDEFSKILAKFLLKKIFPADIEKALLRTLQNPAASSCAEDGLLRVLRRYDSNGSKLQMVEDVTMHGMFRTNDGRVFQKGKKLRKRFQCKEISTGRIYLFSPVYEVEMLEG